MLFDYIQYLPNEIIHIIWNNVSTIQKFFLNKEHYNTYNHLIDTIIPQGRYESYIRDIVRHDCNYVFKYLIHNKFNTWLQIYNYKYDNIIFSDFINFLLFYSKNNNSSKCNNSINLSLQLSELKKKGRKNNRIKYNKWSN